jgi:ADP-ribose pyrophosphatase YjhB (NUDIX family)
MMRSAVIIQEGDHIALIERVRDGHVYFVFPGGTVETDETAEAAAAREAYEELGVQVHIHSLAAAVTFRDEQQQYYHATISAGQFGTGAGAELTADPASPRGSYRPVWLSRRDFARHDIRPRALAQALSAGMLTAGMPALRLIETP